MEKIITIYHGSEQIVEEPTFGKGKKHNDFGLGFYCTESDDLAKEWAVSSLRNGFSNKYTLDTEYLNILNLNSPDYTILNWIAVLVEHRVFSLKTPVARRAKRYLIDNFSVNVNAFDLITGYRADDSYFDYAESFLNNGISVEQLAKAMKLGKLGEAFDSDEQVILLIDEIDKADLEFPNDLLWELDQMEFYIHETKRTVKAKHRPIVIITSNAEKELPDAFLRRCIFHYIDFPDAKLMEEIVRTHYPDVEEHLLKSAMDVFYDIRSYRDIRKKPSTSELIDWINALQIGGIPADRIRAELPFVGVVVKKDEDLETVRRKISL